VIKVTITAQPSPDKIALGLEQWVVILRDFRPAFGDIRHVYNRHQVRHFETEGASTGEAWPDNSAPEVPILPPGPWGRGLRYDEYKRRLFGRAGPTLVFTGKLREAATGGAGALTRETRTTMALGVDSARVPYAAAHHRGDKVDSTMFRREVQLKRRPIIRFNGSPLGRKGDALDDHGVGSFGYAIRQLLQAHVVGARRRSLGFDTHAVDATIARVRAMETR
jgi:hypothetical protein